MGKSPSGFSASGKEERKVVGQDTKRFPVENVSWDEAVEFCRRLSALPEETAARRQYRLPSEAQWEYACRAGSTTHYYFGDDAGSLGGYAWYGDNSGGVTHAVGQKRPNGWGLYDMYGNVWQWCADWHGAAYYAESPTDDPIGPPEGPHHANRGGSWNHPGTCAARRSDTILQGTAIGRASVSPCLRRRGSGNQRAAWSEGRCGPHRAGMVRTTMGRFRSLDDGMNEMDRPAQRSMRRKKRDILLFGSLAAPRKKQNAAFSPPSQRPNHLTPLAGHQGL